MSSTKQKIVVIVVLLLVILFGVGQFFAGALNPATQNAATPVPNANTNATNPLTTQVIAYIPTMPASSTPVEKGTCFANSVAVPGRRLALYRWQCDQ